MCVCVCLCMGSIMSAQAGAHAWVQALATMPTTMHKTPSLVSHAHRPAAQAGLWLIIEFSLVCGLGVLLHFQAASCSFLRREHIQSQSEACDLPSRALYYSNRCTCALPVCHMNVLSMHPCAAKQQRSAARQRRELLVGNGHILSNDDSPKFFTGSGPQGL